MRRPLRRVSALAAAAALTLAGCGGSGDAGDTATGGDAASSAPSASGSPGESPSPTEPASPTESESGSAAEDDAVEIEVEIENGQVTPSGERVDAQVGQTVRFVVESDAADELHVHASPERTFTFEAGADDQEFELQLTRPGVIEVELHELGDVVVTIAARP
jgi:plastocyanin